MKTTLLFKSDKGRKAFFPEPGSGQSRQKSFSFTADIFTSSPLHRLPGGNYVLWTGSVAMTLFHNSRKETGRTAHRGPMCLMGLTLTESLCVHGEKGSHWASFQILQTSSQCPRPFLQHLVSVGNLGRVRHSSGHHRKTERKRHSPVLKELNNPGNSHAVLRI